MAETGKDEPYCHRFYWLTPKIPQPNSVLEIFSDIIRIVPKNIVGLGSLKGIIYEQVVGAAQVKPFHLIFCGAIGLADPEGLGLISYLWAKRADYRLRAILLKD